MKVSKEDGSNTLERSSLLSSPVATTLEDSLVVGCIAGDRGAWRALHRRYLPVAVAFLRKLGAPDNELDDVCQDVFTELFRYLPRFRGQAELKTWLYRICASQARRARTRSRALRAVRDRMESERPLTSSVPPVTMTDSTARQLVTRALDALRDDERLALVLYEFEGLPAKQIAEIAGCPEATVWRRLHYARRTFKQALGLSEADAAGGA